MKHKLIKIDKTYEQVSTTNPAMEIFNSVTGKLTYAPNGSIYFNSVDISQYHGYYTSTVQKIVELDDTFEVHTRNSIYTYRQKD